MTGVLEYGLTEGDTLSKTNQDTTEDKHTEFMIRRESLDECSDNRNETTDSHAPSSAKTIGLPNHQTFIPFHWQLEKHLR